MTKKKTLWLCLDGIRVDALKKAAPFISKTLLTKHHVNYSLQCRNEIPVSTPCWLSLIRGQSVATHGIKTNRQRIPPVDKSRLESEHKIRLEVYHRGWDRFSRFFHSSTPTHRVYSSKPLLKRLKSTPSSRLPEYLCYYDVTADDAGHGHGFSPHVREYLREIERFDTLVREVCRLLEERSLTHKEQWLLVLLTDHGGSTIPSYRRPKQLTRGLVKSNNHLRSTLKKYTGTHSDPSHPQHRRYFQIYLEINPGQRHPTTTTQNIDPSLDYRSPLQRTLSWFHSHRGGSSDKYNSLLEILFGPPSAEKDEETETLKKEKVQTGALYHIYQAITTLHGRGYIHGDIKPDNILVPSGDDDVSVADENGEEQTHQTIPKLIDFGLASSQDEAECHGGTPYYLGPFVMGESFHKSDDETERVKKQQRFKLLQHNDYWSYGILLWWVARTLKRIRSDKGSSSPSVPQETREVDSDNPFKNVDQSYYFSTFNTDNYTKEDDENLKNKIDMEIKKSQITPEQLKITQEQLENLNTSEVKTCCGEVDIPQGAQAFTCKNNDSEKSCVIKTVFGDSHNSVITRENEVYKKVKNLSDGHDYFVGLKTFDTCCEAVYKCSSSNCEQPATHVQHVVRDGDGTTQADVFFYCESCLKNAIGALQATPIKPLPRSQLFLECPKGYTDLKTLLIPSATDWHPYAHPDSDSNPAVFMLHVYKQWTAGNIPDFTSINLSAIEDDVLFSDSDEDSDVSDSDSEIVPSTLRPSFLSGLDNIDKEISAASQKLFKPETEVKAGSEEEIKKENSKRDRLVTKLLLYLKKKTYF